MVLTTLHTNSAAQTIDRVIDMFPADQHRQVRQQPAEVLKAVVSMQLVEKADGSGMVAAVEILRDLLRTSKLVKEGNITELNEEIERSVAFFRMQSMNQSLAALVINGVVSRQTAAQTSINPGDLDLMLRKFFFAQTGDPDTPGRKDLCPPTPITRGSTNFWKSKNSTTSCRSARPADLAERDAKIRELEDELHKRAEQDAERDARAKAFEEEKENPTRSSKTSAPN